MESGAEILDGSPSEPSNTEILNMGDDEGSSGAASAIE